MDHHRCVEQPSLAPAAARRPRSRALAPRFAVISVCSASSTESSSACWWKRSSIEYPESPSSGNTTSVACSSEARRASATVRFSVDVGLRDLDDRDARRHARVPVAVQRAERAPLVTGKRAHGGERNQIHPGIAARASAVPSRCRRPAGSAAGLDRLVVHELALHRRREQVHRHHQHQALAARPRLHATRPDWRTSWRRSASPSSVPASTFRPRTGSRARPARSRSR